MIAIFILGMASGLPLPLTFSTLSLWLAESDVSRTSIGLFAAIGTPYTLKFLWAPLVDRLPIPWLTHSVGRRRSWLFLTQAGLLGSLIALGMSDPAENLWLVAFWALVVAVFSATQDIVIDAYRVELLNEQQQGAGASSAVFGYMTSMRLIGGTLALILADHMSWGAVYALMGVLVLMGSGAALWIGEPEAAVKEEREHSPTGWLRHALIDPFRQFTEHTGWWVILLFVLLYKFGDAFAGVMTNPFLYDIGFSKSEIGVFVKTYGLFPLLVGSAVGGMMVYRLGAVASLWICGILQMLSNLMFIVQAHVGADSAVLALTIGIENLSAGMGTAAFVAFISMLCHREYTATQYALLSALAAVARTWLSASAGVVADSAGWTGFFLISTLAALPGLLSLLWVGKYVKGAAETTSNINKS